MWICSHGQIININKNLKRPIKKVPSCTAHLIYLATTGWHFNVRVNWRISSVIETCCSRRCCCVGLSFYTFFHFGWLLRRNMAVYHWLLTINHKWWRLRCDLSARLREIVNICWNSLRCRRLVCASWYGSIPCYVQSRWSHNGRYVRRSYGSSHKWSAYARTTWYFGRCNACYECTRRSNWSRLFLSTFGTPRFNLDFVLGHLSHFSLEDFLECLCHYYDILAWLVVDVAIIKNGLKIIDCFLGLPIVVVFQAFLDRAKIHGHFDDFVIVWQIEFASIDWLLERPTVLVFPDYLHNCLC